MPRPSVVSVASSTTTITIDHIRNWVTKRIGGLSLYGAEAAGEHCLPLARPWSEIWVPFHFQVPNEADIGTLWPYLQFHDLMTQTFNLSLQM